MPKDTKPQYSQQQKIDHAGDAGRPPTARSLFDRLSSIFASGRFPYTCTFRTPAKKAPKGDPRHDPEAQTKLAEEIARSLAAQGIAVAIAPAFSSINSPTAPVPHFHAALSRIPSASWMRAFAREFGPRAVHVSELGTSELDPARVAYYIARQSTGITIACPREGERPLVKSSSLDDAAEIVGKALDEGPAEDAPAEPPTPNPSGDPKPEGFEVIPAAAREMLARIWPRRFSPKPEEVARPPPQL